METVDNTLGKIGTAAAGGQRRYVRTRKAMIRQTITAVLRVLNMACLLALVLVFALPFIWMVSTSLKTLPETMIFPPRWIPTDPVWQNYADAWNTGPFLQYFTNSVIIAGGILILQMLTIIPAAYAFARYKFVGRASCSASSWSRS